MKREPGYYWVKDDGEWEIAKWFEWYPGKCEWDYFDRSRNDEDFEEIDERRIERPTLAEAVEKLGDALRRQGFR